MAQEMYAIVPDGRFAPRKILPAAILGLRPANGAGNVCHRSRWALRAAEDTSGCYLGLAPCEWRRECMPSFLMGAGTTNQTFDN